MSTSQANRRHTITQAVLTELGRNNAQGLAEAQQWWSNRRKSGGLRLTALGDAAFQQADLEHFSFELDLEVEDFQRVGGVVQMLLDLDRLMNTPYYFFRVRNSRSKMLIRVYDSRVAVLVNLYGNFLDYLEMVKDTAKSSHKP